ncbi:hypothetical protein [Lonepinella sp. BR2882]|uniref:hypothetical protein n=1 Tax=Lonepinella sp. BR2882 TaxID=3095283 RepID=UPI003F6DCAF3
MADLNVFKPIVEKFNNQLGLKFIVQYERSEYLVFKTQSKGIPLWLSFRAENKKISACFSVGDSSSDCRFSAEKIGFSPLKSEKAICKDILERLKLTSFADKVNAVFEERESKKQAEDIRLAELAIFQKYLPFKNQGYRNGFYAHVGKMAFDLNEAKNHLEIRASTDVLMKICAAISEIVKDE